MKAPTDFGGPKPRAKKKEGGSNKLSVKIKGAPNQVHKVLNKMSGAGDLMKPPGIRGPRGMHTMPNSNQRAPALAKPLGQVKGKKPTLTAKSTGVGDPPVGLHGGVQAPIVSMTKVAVYKRPKKPSSHVKSNNPESPKPIRGGSPKKIKANGKPLNSVMMLKFQDEEPPRATRSRPRIDTSIPPSAMPKRAPEPDMVPLFSAKGRTAEKPPKLGRPGPEEEEPGQAKGRRKG